MHAMSTLSTKPAVLEGMRCGDRQAWQTFYECYTAMLLLFAKRLGLSDADAADAVQQTLIAIWEVFSKLQEPFDLSKGRFRSWLRAIAKRKVVDMQRSRAARDRNLKQFAREQADLSFSESEMDELFEIEWQNNLLRRALDQVARDLDPTVFQAFWLTAIQDQSPDKVGRFLGVGRNAVYISRHRVLKRLRAVVADLTEKEL